MCKYGNQNPPSPAQGVDGLFRDEAFPARVKIGIPGCPRCCGESHRRAIGIIGKTGA